MTIRTETDEAGDMEGVSAAARPHTFLIAFSKGLAQLARDGCCLLLPSTKKANIGPFLRVD
jgi:hypothetical protein